jgi:hypothetical protein
MAWHRCPLLRDILCRGDHGARRQGASRRVRRKRGGTRCLSSSLVCSIRCRQRRSGETVHGHFPLLRFTSHSAPAGRAPDLISPEWIVTAGHRFHGVDRNPVSGPTPYPTTVTIGTVDANDGTGVVVGVVAVRQTRTDDIALVRLAEGVTGIPVLRIARTAPTVGESLTLAGWGATTSPGHTPVLRSRRGHQRRDVVADRVHEGIAAD